MMAQYFLGVDADSLKQAMPVWRMDPDDDWLQSTMALIQWSNGRALLEDSLAIAQIWHNLGDYD